MTKYGRLLTVFLLASAFHLAKASIVCATAATPALVRAEGLTEQLGDILLSCTGAPGDRLNTSLIVSLSVNVTSRLSAGNSLPDVALTTDTGVVPGVTPILVAANAVGFGGIGLTVPASGEVFLRVTNLRGAVGSENLSNPVPITAWLSSELLLTNAHLTVGVPQRALLSSSDVATVTCTGSPAPSTITMSGLFAAGTQVSSTRVTEGFPGSFAAKQPNTDSGMRIVVRYAGFPQGARLFVPDVVAGSDAVEPTAGGDLVLPASGGQFASTAAGSLLLARVPNTDANGAGGAPVFTPGPVGSPTVSFDAASEVNLVNGAGMVVYEVVSANLLVREESAQLPTFVALAPTGNGDFVAPATVAVTLGPVSTVAVADATDPVPRFVAAPPPPDCAALGDCAVFPKLSLDQTALAFAATAGSGTQTKIVYVENTGGGEIAWNATVAYQSGNGWISLFLEPNVPPASGFVEVSVHPQTLVPGTYQATLTVDAGPTAGTQTIPITLTVNAPGVETPQVTSVVNAASLAASPIAPGSLASVLGSWLNGKSMSVTFDGLAAKLLYTGASQIYLQVPLALGVQTSAQMIVAVDGAVSAPVNVALTPISPGIFANGVLNQDDSLNSATNPARVGTVMEIFATGLPSPDAGTMSVIIGGREVTSLDFAGPWPGWYGIEQVNVRIPSDLGGMTTNLAVCGMIATTGQKMCSPPVKVTLR